LPFLFEGQFVYSDFRFARIEYFIHS
jgi:hypothetical protein